MCTHSFNMLPMGSIIVRGSQPLMIAADGPVRVRIAGSTANARNLPAPVPIGKSAFSAAFA